MREGGRCFAVNTAAAAGVKHLNGVENACRRRRRTKLISLPFFLPSPSHYFRRVDREELGFWGQSCGTSLKDDVFLVREQVTFVQIFLMNHPVDLIPSYALPYAREGEWGEVTRKGEPRVSARALGKMYSCGDGGGQRRNATGRALAILSLSSPL